MHIFGGVSQSSKRTPFSRPWAFVVVTKTPRDCSSNSIPSDIVFSGFPLQKRCLSASWISTTAVLTESFPGWQARVLTWSFSVLIPTTRNRFDSRRLELRLLFANSQWSTILVLISPSSHSDTSAPLLDDHGFIRTESDRNEPFAAFRVGG
jgi:hypothetical protein